jgi:hypothetical protein
MYAAKAAGKGGWRLAGRTDVAGSALLTR